MGNQENRKSSELIGTLGGCLIEGDSEQKARERKGKRRALMISIGLQSAALVALVVTPLLAKPEKLASLITTPMPPYHRPAPARPEEGVQRPTAQKRGICLTCIHNVSPIPISHDKTKFILPGDGNDLPTGFSEPSGPESIPVIGTQVGPKPPADTTEQKKRISVGGAVQQALLIHRVDPAYPPIAKTLRKSGQVHIKAIIATDGSIEALQALDGDPLLVRSAMDAVGQWRYKPTLLNGSPVEVETVITVIYTLNQ